MEIISTALDTLGAVFIAYAALRVHHRVLYEHKIDEEVFTTMRREQVVGIAGVIMVVLGFIVDMNIILG